MYIKVTPKLLTRPCSSSYCSAVSRFPQLLWRRGRCSHIADQYEALRLRMAGNHTRATQQSKPHHLLGTEAGSRVSRACHPSRTSLPSLPMKELLAMPLSFTQLLVELHVMLRDQAQCGLDMRRGRKICEQRMMAVQSRIPTQCKKTKVRLLIVLGQALLVLHC